MDTGVASVAALGLSPFWPAAGLAAMCVALVIASWAAFRTVRGYM